MMAACAYIFCPVLGLRLPSGYGMLPVIVNLFLAKEWLKPLTILYIVFTKETIVASWVMFIHQGRTRIIVANVSC